MIKRTSFLKKYLFLYFGIFIYSVSTFMSKAASFHPLFSIQFLVLYGCGLSFLILYALLWQQVLKTFPLTTAYANRPFATVLGMLWGVLFFGEEITGNMLVGTALILIGIRIVVKADGS